MNCLPSGFSASFFLALRKFFRYTLKSSRLASSLARRSDLRTRLEVSRELFNVYLKNFRRAKKKLAENPEGRQFKFRYGFCLCYAVYLPNAVVICDMSASALLVNNQSLVILRANWLTMAHKCATSARALHLLEIVQITNNLFNILILVSPFQ